MNNKTDSRVYTLSAFLFGYILIDNLSSQEQNELGNWFMLVGQTLCTNGAYKFSGEWKQHINENHGNINDMLYKVKNSIDTLNDIIK